MLLPLSLRARLVIIFLAMLCMVLIFSASMVWNTYQVSTKINETIHKDMILYETTRKLELALANQKGYLTYFFLDGNSKWLESLNLYQQMFRQCFKTEHLLIGQTINRLNTFDIGYPRS